MYRLLDGDPLELEELGTARRDELCYLIASTRILYRSAARVAYGACIYGAGKPIDDWIAACIDDGIAGILEDERLDDAGGVPVDPDEEGYYHAITALLDVSVEEARRACIEFNALPLEPRLAYFQFSLKRSLLESTRDPDGGDALREDLARALRTVLSGGRP